MANVIQIKRGNGPPTSGTLADGELGFDKENNVLYIGNGSTIIPLNQTGSQIVIQDEVTGGSIMIGFDNQDHGLYSYGYAPTSSTWTSNGVWMVCRDSSGEVILNGNAATASAAKLTTTANAIAYYTNTTGAFGTKASAKGALYATSANGALNFGTLPVGEGGTGNTTLTSGELLVGAGTSALTTKAILQLSSRASLNWSTTTANQHKIPDVSCIAYWNGAYDGTNSNLTYCLAGTIIGSNGGTIAGTLVLSKTQDASGTVDSSPALIVGGASTSQHIEIDGNEILSKSDGTTPGTLNLQDSTGSVVVNGSGGLSIHSRGTNTTAFRCRNISYGTAAPSSGAGNNGDIYLLYSS